MSCPCCVRSPPRSLVAISPRWKRSKSSSTQHHLGSRQSRTYKSGFLIENGFPNTTYHRFFDLPALCVLPPINHERNPLIPPPPFSSAVATRLPSSFQFFARPSTSRAPGPEEFISTAVAKLDPSESPTLDICDAARPFICEASGPGACVRAAPITVPLPIVGCFDCGGIPRGAI